MRGAIPSFPQYAFMTWCSVNTGKTLPFSVILWRFYAGRHLWCVSVILHDRSVIKQWHLWEEMFQSSFPVNKTGEHSCFLNWMWHAAAWAVNILSSWMLMLCVMARFRSVCSWHRDLYVKVDLRSVLYKLFYLQLGIVIHQCIVST